MDTLIPLIAAEGIPALTLWQAIEATDLNGAASYTTALAAIGPGGMREGIATLAFMQLVSFIATKFACDQIYLAVVRELYREGFSTEDILTAIDGYPVSKGLKAKLKEEVTILSEPVC